MNRYIELGLALLLAATGSQCIEAQDALELPNVADAPSASYQAEAPRHTLVAQADAQRQLGIATDSNGTPSGRKAESSEAITEIVITGSRIRRKSIGDAAPVTVVDQEALARTGLTSLADALQRLPSAAGGISTKMNFSSNLGNPPDGSGVSAGSAEIDLRYLGAKRTLVLVDGLRYVNGTAGSGIPASVDLNNIPESMIERIEVLQSAASPQYGSDAIAGVVNVITKASQHGLQVSAQHGQYQQGDGQTSSFNISYGSERQGSRFAFGASYVKQKEVKSSARSISAYPRPFATSCDPGGCSNDAPNGDFLIYDFGNPANTAGLQLTLKGTVTGVPRWDPLNPTGPNSDFQAQVSEFYNTQLWNYQLTPSERFGVWASLTQAISDNTNLRVRAVYNRRDSVSQAAPLPLGVGPAARNGNMLDHISIDVTNPYNPFGVTLSAGDPGTPTQSYFYVDRRLLEQGARYHALRIDSISATATLDGSLNMAGRKWYWDVNAVVGFNDAKHSLTGNVDGANVAQALGPLANCTAPCVPLNLFGSYGAVTPAMLGFITHVQQDRSNQRLFDVTANLSGDLFTLPAGPLGAAIGVEHRDEQGAFISDPVVAAGRGADIPAQSYEGEFMVNELYGEVRVPLLSGKQIADSLELNGAARYSNYSTFGSNTTFTGGLLWKPVKDLALRGSYAESLRAAGIGELFGTQSLFSGTFIDPCNDFNGIVSGTPASATVKANCIANGVPADGSYHVPVGYVPAITGGNSALRPETAHTTLFGLVYTPEWARSAERQTRLSIEANYFDIKLENAISSIGPDVLLDRCAQTGDALSCGSIKRISNGFITQINALLKNIAGFRTRGVDFNVNYNLAHTSAGAFGISLNNSFLLKYDELVPSSSGNTLIDHLGTERGSPDQAFPRLKTNAIVDWVRGIYSASYTGRYIGSVTEIQNGNRLASRFYSDVQFSVRPRVLSDGLTLTVGINNAFNLDPPGCVSCSLNNYDPTTYDVPGRFEYLRIAYRQ
jgi:iron complex outermembrane recepter protein